MRALADHLKELQAAAGFEETLNVLIRTWDRDCVVDRLWKKDSSLWTGQDEDRWLGWLNVGTLAEPVDELLTLARDVRRSGVKDVVLLAIGGSSLGAEVLDHVLPDSEDSLPLHVIDTTDPAEIRRITSRLDIDSTLFVVSSKSGTTLEPTLLADHFLGLVASRLRSGKPGARFVAITDPGSPLDQLATAEGFSQVWYGRPSVGGRFSVLSNVGLVPISACGIDVSPIVRRAADMAADCGSNVPVAMNPGVRLGLTLGLAARQGRDKITLVLSPPLSALGSWLEQLLAESSGKQGCGLVPIVDEEVGRPSVYGDDRLFVYLRLKARPDRSQDHALKCMANLGHPVVTLSLSDELDVGREFFRWQVATAVCCAVLEVNPFDQPDVEVSKIAARASTTACHSGVSFATCEPLATLDAISLYADPSNARSLLAVSGERAGVKDLLAAHLARLCVGDYFAVLAYIDRNPTHSSLLQRLRHTVRDSCKVATSVGFGPRFLHSTGQLFKGGPGTGVFLQVICDDVVDLHLPSPGHSFGAVKAAQALADSRVLVERSRRLLTVHLGSNVGGGLTQLGELVRSGLR
ncbi:MAG: transaldolase [Acidobacteriota bacterium]|nr:transaldolase [Acidobacteriota bacterium]